MEKLSFKALAIDGSNYLGWCLNAEASLTAKGLQDTIIMDAGPSTKKRAQALVLLRHHLEDSLQDQYLDELNPKTLWDSLKERYDHTKTIHLPRARHDRVHLRVQDYTSVATYNSELLRITSQLKLCGHPVNDEDQIDKTLSTFHPTNMVLST